MVSKAKEALRYAFVGYMERESGEDIDPDTVELGRKLDLAYTTDFSGNYVISAHLLLDTVACVQYITEIASGKGIEVDRYEFEGASKAEKLMNAAQFLESVQFDELISLPDQAWELISKRFKGFEY